MNERITEDIVRDHFKKDISFDQILLEEQKSKIPRIEKLLRSASKSGNGAGKPEFIITFLKDNPDYVIVIECKPDITKHESKTRNNYKSYAVDGVLLYSSYLSKDFDVLSIAVSGEKKNNLKISHFLQLKGEIEAKPIFGDKLLTITNYLDPKPDEKKFKEDYDKLIKYSQTLNDKLHSLKIKESQRSLLLSGILIALDDKHFRGGYKAHDEAKDVAKDLVDTIEKRLQRELNNKEKSENLAVAYSFIKTHTALSQDKEVITTLIDDIDKNIFNFVKTYPYHDVIGELYIEFLQYSNNDKGLGIVLTPRHITEFFSDIARVNKDSIILDNCAGTGGFLISAMKKMVGEASGDKEKIKDIHNRQLIGIEYQDDIFALLCSNMFIHGDGKSSMVHGSCFDEAIMEIAKKHKPNIGFLNPPYKNTKSDPYELDFVLNNISMLEKNSTCIAIFPMSCALAQKGIELELKKKILKDNTLDAVFSMPNELFNNSNVGTVTCVIVLKTHQPHPKDFETFFGYFKNDGFVKRKKSGRSDYLGKWGAIKKTWLTIYGNKKEVAGLSVKKHVDADDEWCAEAYMETDYSTLKKEDFVKTVKEFVLFQELYLK
jgi:type I restriction-modification system DNA methylase subunit